MGKELESLKNAGLVDGRELWVKGQLYHTFNWAMLFGAIGGAISAAKNLRLLSVKDNELIVSKIVKGQPVAGEHYTKDNVNNVTVKSALGSKKLIITNSQGKKVIFFINGNVLALNEIADLFK